MFERLVMRVRASAERRAREQADALAQRIEALLPEGIEAARGEEGVILSGRALRRRLALDPRLRWLAAVLR